jgi:dynein assembly factor 1
MERDVNGNKIITEDFLKQLCDVNGQYSIPSLNNTLFLHYKGFNKIENLDAYCNIKSIWLECNGIQKIEGLDKLLKLRMVYL